ncbi:MAG TPA: proteasome accessory factor PafA2 family protein [Chthoniobacteraceae bacterium]|nr:proteasome accessory factor PafA2 family protein [Chthoniobacteraceae bacterium]
MKRVFGIETEYGITVDGASDLDVVRESIEIVRSYTEHGNLMKWDYRLEDPHQDARGFRAAELLQDTDEASYYEIDKARSLSFEEIKSDLVLSNGARFYNDHAHPEYSTPECTTIAEIVAQDKAGERILSECARRRNQHLAGGQQSRLYKNNTDFVGHSYGCHDNFLMSRSVPWDQIVSDVVPFLVTRQIFAGAGKLGIEGEDSAGQPGIYQIAQRSDFFSVLCSIDTMNRRPIVNTRDEPHAESELYRRFHVIVGDANMSQWATAMKIGVTSLVLELIEKGHAPQLDLADPIAATKQISRDDSHAWIIELKDGRKISAIDVQRLYLAAAKAHCDRDEEVLWVIQEWETALHDLATDIWLCKDRMDWVAKKFLLDTMREAEGLSWSDPWLQAIDLEYHNVSLDDGLYYELMREGRMRRIVQEDAVRQAIFQPPLTTRAFFRGRAVARFNAEITSIQWDELAFASNGSVHVVELSHPALDADLERKNGAMRDAQNLQELIERLR